MRLHQPPENVKPYRSRAELTRVRQGYILIILATGTWINNLLIALRVFKVI